MFLNVLIYSIIAGASTIIGTLLIFYKYRWARHNSIHLISFAAGIMLALAFLHLIPESLEMVQAEGSSEGEHTEGSIIIFMLVLTAFVVFYALENIIMIHPRHDVEAEEPHRHGKLSILSIVGLTFHSTIDGIIIAVGFKAGFQIGIMTTIAVILHEMPEGIVTTSILLHDMMERIKVFWFSLLVALVTPLGAIVSYFLLGDVSEKLSGSLLALAAGSLLYVSASNLVPETHKEEKKFNTVILVAGMAFLYLIGRLVSH